jgi:hypothetical protein
MKLGHIFRKDLKFMFQFHIKQYGLKGDGSGTSTPYPFQLILRVVGVSEASPKNVWMKDYDTIADAKVGAAALFATGTTTPWVDTPASPNTVESLSAVFTPTF